MTLIRVGRRGQITIPRTIRRRPGLGEGDTLAVSYHEGKVVLEPVRMTFLDLRGSVPVSGVQDVEAIRRRFIEEQARRVVEGEA